MSMEAQNIFRKFDLKILLKRLPNDDFCSLMGLISHIFEVCCKKPICLRCTIISSLIINIMTNVVRFNMGGKVFKVSHTFLFEMHPNSRIAQIASEQQQSVPDGDIVLEWDGDRLKFVMLYLQGEGYITLPKTLLKGVFVDYLAHYGIMSIDVSKIIEKSARSAITYRRQLDDAYIAETKSWNIRIVIGLFAQVCSLNYFTSGEKRRITIKHDDFQTLSRQYDSPACSLKLWMELRTLLLRKGKKKFCPAREECNQYLRKVGLKIVGVTAYQSTAGMDVSDSAMEVAMRADDNDSDTSDEANAFACSIERNK